MMPTPVDRPETFAHAALNGDTLYEIIHGCVVEKEMCFFAAWVASSLISYLRPYVRAHRLGTTVQEAIFILDPATDLRRRPDVAFLSATTWTPGKRFPKSGDLKLCPDLAVEVTSANDIFHRVHEKVEEYFRYGSRQVWLVIPETEKVHVYTGPLNIRVLDINDRLDAGDLIPGWSMPVASLFEE